MSKCLLSEDQDESLAVSIHPRIVMFARWILELNYCHGY